MLFKCWLRCYWLRSGGPTGALYKLNVADPLHSGAINGQRRMMLPDVPPDINHHLKPPVATTASPPAVVL